MATIDPWIARVGSSAEIDNNGLRPLFESALRHHFCSTTWR